VRKIGMTIASSVTQAALAFSSNSVKAISMTNDVNAKLVLANVLSNKLIAACKMFGYYTLMNNIENFNKEVFDKYGFTFNFCRVENYAEVYDRVKDSYKELYGKDNGTNIFNLFEEELGKLHTKHCKLMTKLNEIDGKMLNHFAGIQHFSSIVKPVLGSRFDKLLEDYEDKNIGFTCFVGKVINKLRE
jgi:hypothetical protein